MGCTNSKEKDYNETRSPNEVPENQPVKSTPSTSSNTANSRNDQKSNGNGEAESIRQPSKTNGTTPPVQQKSSNTGSTTSSKSSNPSTSTPKKNPDTDSTTAAPADAMSSLASDIDAPAVQSETTSPRKQPVPTFNEPPIDMNATLVPDPRRFGDVYELGEEIGQGAFSTVRLGINRQTKEKCAIKCISKQRIPPEDEAALKQEVIILRALNHPNILKCYGFFDENEFYYLVMEYMAGGELFDRIVQKTFYSEKEARDVVYILLSTIHYCHTRNIVHRDLKPENLLLSNQEDDAFIKLADFGFAISSQGGFSTLKTQCGTPGYVAPEILSTQPYGKAVDMWSIGVITYILLGGYPPFYDDNQKVLFEKIKKGEYSFHPEYWDAVSVEAKDLISRLLKVNPLERYTSEEALNHSWVDIRLSLSLSCCCRLLVMLQN